MRFVVSFTRNFRLEAHGHPDDRSYDIRRFCAAAKP